MTARALSLAFCFATSSLLAQVIPPPDNPSVKPQPPLAPVESFKEVAPGILQLGLVTLEPGKRLIKFPALVSMKEGPVAYFLVGSGGKVQESILKTNALPAHLQQAMLFLGFKEQSDPTPASPNPTTAGQGVPVRITVHWQMDGKQQEAPAENWILNNKIQEPMPAGDWLYNGSKSNTGAIIAIIADPLSLMNNPSQDSQKQEIWKVRADTVPPVGTVVEVQILWPEAQTANLPPQTNESLAPQPSVMPPAPTPTPAP